MGSRALQVGLIIALGAGLGLLITRPWRETPAEVAPPLADSTVAKTEPAPPAAPATPADNTPPPARTYKLPTLSVTPAVEAKRTAEIEKFAKVSVPRHWLLRGTGPDGYEVRSDRHEVLSGSASVSIASRTNERAATKSGSLMQTIVAGDLAGKRVELSIRTRAQAFRRDFELWMRATDSAGVVIAYDEAQSDYGKASEWQTVTTVMDIPWSAAEIAYGVTLTGPGKIWLDGAQLRVTQKIADLSARMRPAKLGVTVQESDRNGPLPAPSNLDFEDVVEMKEPFYQPPKDELGKSRF